MTDDPATASQPPPGPDRLHASWRGWLDALAAVPADRLTEPGVTGFWCVADLMGHVAFWDRHGRARGETALAGRSSPPVEADPVNAREHAARAGRTPADQRAEMEAAHADLLAFVAALPDDPERRDAVFAAMAVDTDLHYDEHSAEVRAWLAAGPADPMVAVEAAWDEVLAAIDGLPPAVLAEPGVSGGWSAAFVVGHVGFWVHRAAAILAAWRPGEPGPNDDWRSMNEEDAAAHAGDPVEAHLARFAAARDRLRTVAAAVAGSAEERTGFMARVQEETIPHAAEHAAKIRAWRERCDL